MITTTSYGTFPGDARAAAAMYLSKNLAPIPLPPQSKDPGYSGWQNLRLGPDSLDNHFPPQVTRNVGILNGAPSANHLDVDLDCPQALAAAPLLLPATGWLFGRKSAPRSHWIYQVDISLEAAQEKYTDLDGSVLAELRGTGGLTVYPPSTHRDTAEQIERCGPRIGRSFCPSGDRQFALARVCTKVCTNCRPTGSNQAFPVKLAVSGDQESDGDRIAITSSPVKAKGPLTTSVNGPRKSGREDSNLRPHGPEPCALAKLSYAPNHRCV